MKRSVGLLLALCLCLCLTGCGHFVSIMPGADAGDAGPAPPEDVDSFQTRPLLDFMGLEDFADSYYNDTPVALSIYTPERGYRSPIFDRASIIAACDSLRRMKITGRAPEDAAGGQQTVYTFTMDDGGRRACRSRLRRRGAGRAHLPRLHRRVRHLRSVL